MSAPESASRPAPPGPAGAAGSRAACRSRRLTNILGRPAIPGRKAGQSAGAESSEPTVRAGDGPTPRSSAIPTSDGPRQISSSWVPLPLDHLSLHQLSLDQLQRPRATPIITKRYSLDYRLLPGVSEYCWYL